MSYSLTIELSDTAYAVLQQQAQSAAQSPAEIAAAALEQHFGTPDAESESGRLLSESETRAARQRFERHFGAVNLGYATGTDNEGIDADLARAYADPHEDG